MKLAKFLLILFLCLPSLGYAGEGKIADEQPRLEEEIAQWKSGDSIPQYLMEPGNEFNPMSPYTPLFYIHRSHNTELLWRIVLHPQAPRENGKTAFSRILKIDGLSRTAEKLDAINKNIVTDVDTSRLEELQKIFSARCVKIYCKSHSATQRSLP